MRDHLDKVERWRDREHEFHYLPEQYFAGTDISLFIGNKEVIEVSSINFQLREQLRPIYGYNSYTYDTMAIGNRIVLGSITIPYVRKNYLKDLFRPELHLQKTDIDLSIRGDAKLKAEEYIRRRFGDFEDEFPDVKRQSETREHYPSYFGVDFEEDEQEDLRKNGFNMYIAYGKNTVQDIAKLYTTHIFSFKNNLDNLLSRGVQVIKNVYIRSHGQTIEIDNTLYETYEFLAKDIF